MKNYRKNIFVSVCGLMLLSVWMSGCAKNVYAGNRQETVKQSEEIAKVQDSKITEAATEKKDFVTEKTQTEKESESETKKNIPGMDSQYLMLVNKTHPLSKDYVPELDFVNQGGVKVDKSILEELNAMIQAAAEEGHTVIVCSGYRTQERQQTILDNNIAKLENQGMSYVEAYNEVTREVMPAGYSEHATGLAVDITGVGNQRLEEDQEQTAENQWLREHCSEYGFILRYPRDKEKITEIDYEPWHFRYVGKEAAEYMTAQKLTLEEYLELK